MSEGTVPWLVTIILLSIGLAITVSPVVYNTIERVEMVLVMIIIVFLVVAKVIATNLSAWTGIVTQAPQGVANLPSYIQDLLGARVLGAATILVSAGVIFTWLVA